MYIQMWFIYLFTIVTIDSGVSVSTSLLLVSLATTAMTLDSDQTGHYAVDSLLNLTQFTIVLMLQL